MTLEMIHEQPFKCPTCGYQMNRTSSITDPEVTPDAGDYTICIQCGELLVYGDNLVPRLATKDPPAKTINPCKC